MTTRGGWYGYEPYVTHRSRMDLYEKARLAGFPALTVENPGVFSVSYGVDSQWGWWVAATNTPGSVLAEFGAALDRLATDGERRE